MFMVVLGTFEWSSFRIIKKIPRSDAFVLVLVSGVTVVTDLAMAVVIGVIVSALVFAWNNAKQIRVSRKEHGPSQYYSVEGPLFFGSTTAFLTQFNVAEDKQDVIIDFFNSKVCDHSGLEAIDTLAERYMKSGKTLHLLHLSPDCKQLLKKAGDLVEVNVIEDPNYLVTVVD